MFIGRDYQNTKSYSEKFAGTIDDEVKLLIDRAYQDCEKILKDNADKITQVTEYLLAHETMSGSQFRACMEGENIGENTQTSLFEAFVEENSENNEE